MVRGKEVRYILNFRKNVYFSIESSAKFQYFNKDKDMMMSSRVPDWLCTVMSLTYNHIHREPEKYSGPKDIINLVSDKQVDLQNDTRLAIAEAEKLTQLHDLN